MGSCRNSCQVDCCCCPRAMAPTQTVCSTLDCCIHLLIASPHFTHTNPVFTKFVTISAYKLATYQSCAFGTNVIGLPPVNPIKYGTSLPCDTPWAISYHSVGVRLKSLIPLQQDAGSAVDLCVNMYRYARPPFDATSAASRYADECHNASDCIWECVCAHRAGCGIP
jgi:hypothetical protein